jgi:hypothetical protein
MNMLMHILSCDANTKFTHLGSRKSLLNVFSDGSCHPGMTLVIDDRLKVWDEKDQDRVHVVPAFAPYYAPQAEVKVCSVVYFDTRVLLYGLLRAPYLLV